MRKLLLFKQICWTLQCDYRGVFVTIHDFGQQCVRQATATDGRC